jgi:hypothetical protein
MPDPTNMIERVARALCAADGHDPDGSSFSSCGDPYWEFYRIKAKAAVSAMREPTGAMVYAGFLPDREATSAEVWPAMIDAALAEEV